MNKELLKQRVCEAIDANREKICAIGQHIFENPELGYKEFSTSELVQKTLDEMFADGTVAEIAEKYSEFGVPGSLITK